MKRPRTALWVSGLLSGALARSEEKRVVAGSLLTVARVQGLGVKRLIVRATTPMHEKILQHLGVKEVVLPAVEAAERLSNSLLFEKILDSVALSTEYTIIELDAPDEFIGQTLEQIGLPKRFNVTLITIRRPVTRDGLFGIGHRVVEEIIGVPTPTTVVERGDVLILFGTKQALDLVSKAEPIP
jgi:trk system potassium uptake protein TrkA